MPGERGADSEESGTAAVAFSGLYRDDPGHAQVGAAFMRVQARARPGTAVPFFPGLRGFVWVDSQVVPEYPNFRDAAASLPVPPLEIELRPNAE